MTSTQAIYLDIEEEIPDLVDRLRQSHTEEVPVVVPPRSRVGQSRFNFQLLRDFARSLGKRVAVVSADGGVRQMAEEAGFPTFTDMDEFRWAVERAPIAAPAPVATYVATPGTAAGVATVVRPVAAPAERQAPPTRAPRMVVDKPERGVGRESAGPGRFLLYLGAGLILLVGMLSAAILVPSAQVTLTAKASPITADAEVTAAPNTAPVHVRTISANKNASRQFQATGVKDTPAVASAGTVTFSNSCSPSATFKISPGQIVSTASGVQFTVQAAGTVESKADLPVLANQPGAAGNVGAGTITQINNNTKAGQLCLSVNNAAGTSGGADEKKDTYVSQADLDSAKAALHSELAAVVADALASQAQANEKLGDAVDFSDNFAATQKANDFVPAFTATLTVTGNGALYNADDVRKALVANLQKQVPDGQALTDNAVQTDFHLTSSSADGHLTFAGRASGYTAPKIDYDKIRARLLGSTTASARLYLETLPVESVSVKEKPFSLPIMPVLGTRIDIKYVVERAPAQTPTQ